MSVDALEQLPARPVLRKRVCRRPQAVQSVLSVRVCLELSTQVVVGLIRWVLEVVFAVGGSLPNVEGDVGDWVLGLEVADDAVHIRDNALVLVLDDGLAQVAPGCVGRPD